MSRGGERQSFGYAVDHLSRRVVIIPDIRQAVVVKIRQNRIPARPETGNGRDLPQPHQDVARVEPYVPISSRFIERPEIDLPVAVKIPNNGNVTVASDEDILPAGEGRETPSFIQGDADVQIARGLVKCQDIRQAVAVKIAAAGLFIGPETGEPQPRVIEPAAVGKGHAPVAAGGVETSDIHPPVAVEVAQDQFAVGRETAGPSHL